MTEIEQLLHDSEQATPETRRDLLLAFLVKPIEPKSSQPIGVWFNNSDFFRYRGKLPIVVESESPMRQKHFAVLSGCISCQISKVNGKVKRWLVLPA